MPYYRFAGTLTHGPVDFYIHAETPERAKAAAAAGRYDSHESDGDYSNIYACEIDLDTLEVVE